MSVNFEEVKDFAVSCADKIKENIVSCAGKLNKAYDEYDISIDSRHYTDPESEPTCTGSYKAKLKVRLSDMIAGAVVVTLALSFFRTVLKIFR